MIPWYECSFDESELVNIKKVLKSNFLNDGEFTTEFECRFADLCRVDYAIAVSNGTMALALTLMAYKIGVGDEVIVPDFTFIATANAVSLTGAKPVFVDIDIWDLNMNFNNIKITKKTKAIIPVHINGRILDTSKLKKFGVPIIEDCAEAIGMDFNGEVGCFSFAPSKIITTGQGGMVVTNDRDLNNRVRELKDQGRLIRGTGGDDVHPTLGFNSKLTNLQSAVGIAQLKKLPSRLNRMRDIYSLYQRNINIIQHYEHPLWIDMLVENRDGLVDFLLKKGIQTRKFWFPIHTQKPYLEKRKYIKTEYVSANGLWLPSSFTLTNKEIKYVCDKVNEFTYS
jgi:perosamine synthetase